MINEGPPLKNASKDFAAIAGDYEFFMAHSTEAENDARDYQSFLNLSISRHRSIRLLDFGCGAGDFTARFLEHIRWSPQRLQISLVEPVQAQRYQAAERLRRYTASPIDHASKLASIDGEGFDVILANHVFYYVSDLEGTLAEIVSALDPQGLFLTAIAGRDNAMFRFWEKGFAYSGKPIPYWLAEDFEVALTKRGILYKKRPSSYEIVFPDSVQNRKKILRFLCADHLPGMPERELLSLFDAFVRDDRIEMHTHSMHFMIRSAVR